MPRRSNASATGPAAPCNRVAPFGLAARAVLLSVWAAVAAGGCDDPPRRSPPPDTRPATPAEKPMEPIDFDALAATDPTPARPGYLVGRVLGADGKPIRTSGGTGGVRVEVTAAGVREDAQNVTVRFDVGPDGTFAKKLEPGTYTSITARIEFTFEDHAYRLPLPPANGSESRQETAFGVAQDFAFKLTGVRPGQRADPERPEVWIGGTINAHYIGVDPIQRRTLRSAPQGTLVRFTLTPQGTLADGSRVPPIVLDRRYDTSGSALDRPLLTDLPLARYRMAGVEQRPDGSRRSVLFLQPDNQTWAETVEGTFSADLSRALLEPQMIHFMRQDN